MDMSNPEFEDVANAFKSLKVSNVPGASPGDGNISKEKALPPIPPAPQKSPYHPRYPAHRKSSDDDLPLSLRPNIPSSTVYPPPISMPTPYTSYLDRDRLATNPLPRPPMLHPALAASAPSVTPPRASNPYTPPRRISMPRPELPQSFDLSMPEPTRGLARPFPLFQPPTTPHRVSNPYVNGFSTPQPPKPDPISPPPKGGSESSRQRAASVPPTDTALDTQCSAITRAGKRCTRQVKTGPALAFQAPGVPIDRLCFQHMKDGLQPTGFYSHARAGVWIGFDEWIPDYLQADTQAALRAEMAKTASSSDEDGYIYAYEIRNPNTPNEVHIKVGRSVNLVKRLDEWGKQCGSREVIPRGWWPGTIENNNQEDSTNTISLLKGRIVPGEKGKYCHRLERLIHLELADVALNAAHLTLEFANSKKSSAKKGKADKDSSPSKSSSATKPLKKPCPDCGAVHKEIFTLERITSGKMKAREWEDVVQPVIEKWGKFVTEHL